MFESMKYQMQCSQCSALFHLIMATNSQLDRCDQAIARAQDRLRRGQLNHRTTEHIRTQERLFKEKNNELINRMVSRIEMLNEKMVTNAVPVPYQGKYREGLFKFPAPIRKFFELIGNFTNDVVEYRELVRRSGRPIKHYPDLHERFRLILEKREVKLDGMYAYLVQEFKTNLPKIIEGFNARLK